MKIVLLTIIIFVSCDIVDAQQIDSSLFKGEYHPNLDSLYALQDTLTYESIEWQLYADNIARLIRVINQKDAPTLADYFHLFHDRTPELGSEAIILQISNGGDEQAALDAMWDRIKNPNNYSSGVLRLIRKYNFLFHMRSMKAYYIWPKLKIETDVAPFMRNYFMYVVIEDHSEKFHKLIFDMKSISNYNKKKKNNGLIIGIFDGKGYGLTGLSIKKYEQDWKKGHK